jgi:hypothetical protein
MTPVKLLASILPVISLARIFISSFGFHGFIENVFSRSDVVPRYAIKLFINGHSRSTSVVFATPDDRTVSVTIIGGFCLLLVLFSILLVGLLSCKYFLRRRM